MLGTNATWIIVTVKTEHSVRVFMCCRLPNSCHTPIRFRRLLGNPCRRNMWTSQHMKNGLKFDCHTQFHLSHGKHFANVHSGCCRVFSFLPSAVSAHSRRWLPRDHPCQSCPPPVGVRFFGHTLSPSVLPCRACRDTESNYKTRKIEERRAQHNCRMCREH